jgi:hypothetical protein
MAATFFVISSEMRAGVICDFFGILLRNQKKSFSETISVIGNTTISFVITPTETSVPSRKLSIIISSSLRCAFNSREQFGFGFLNSKAGTLLLVLRNKAFRPWQQFQRY